MDHQLMMNDEESLNNLELRLYRVGLGMEDIGLSKGRGLHLVRFLGWIREVAEIISRC